MIDKASNYNELTESKERARICRPSTRNQVRARALQAFQPRSGHHYRQVGDKTLIQVEGKPKGALTGGRSIVRLGFLAPGVGYLQCQAQV